MQISPVGLGMVATAIVFSVGPTIYRLYCQSHSENYARSQFKDTEFRVSAFAYAFPAMAVFLGVLLLHDSRRHPEFFWSSVIFGLGAICVGIWIGFRNSQSIVVFSNGYVEYRKGKKRVAAKLADIETVSILQWYGVSVDVKAKGCPTITMPLHFKKGPELLAMLKYYRPESPETKERPASQVNL